MSKKHSGVRPLQEPGHFEIRLRIKHPRSGRRINLKRRFAGTIREAVAERKRLRDEALYGSVRGAPSDRTTLRQYAERWLAMAEARRQKPSTLRLKKQVLNQRILPSMGDLYIAGINRTEVEDWLIECSKVNAAPVTVDGWLRILKALVAAHYEEAHLGPSPIAGVQGPKIPERSEDDPNSLPAAVLPEFLARMQELYPQHYAMTYLAVTTGMRWGELSALEWNDLDEAAGTLRVVRSQVNKHVGTTKTGKSREIGLVDEQIEVLRRHRRTLIEDQAAGLGCGLVFPSQTGGHSYPSRLQKPLERVRRDLGLPYRLTPHGLRRTFNNLLRVAGVDRQVLRSLTGHSSEAMTGLYSTVGRDEKKAAVASVVNLTRRGGHDE